MKKIISLVLAAVLTLSLAACGTKNDSKGDQPAAPASALDLLEKVWSTYTDDEKFPPPAATTRGEQQGGRPRRL